MRRTFLSPKQQRAVMPLFVTTAILMLGFTWLVRIHVFVDAGEQSPMDLAWQAGSEDPNGIPQNPQWVWQLTHNNPQSDRLPDANKLCDGFPYKVPNDPSKGVTFGNPPCVSQTVTLDYPYGFHDFLCSNFGGQAGKLHGHVDWLPARYDGLLFWKGFTPWYQLGDGDYNFWLIPPNGGGLTTANPEAISMEFDSHETINHFDSPWWKRFHKAVDDGNAETMVRRNYAIAIGLVGIDTEHEDHSELHPVYAMAIHVKDDPTDDVWAIFGRNWGNEGYCSQNQQLLPFQGNQLKLLLPSAAGRSAPQLLPTTAFQVSAPAVTWNWAPVSNGILFTTNLQAPAVHSRLNGELHLKWKVTPTARLDHQGLSLGREALSTLSSVENMQIPQKEAAVETEASLSEMFKSLPAEQQKSIESRLMAASPVAPPDTVHAARIAPKLLHNPFNTFEFVIPPSPKEIPKPVSVRDKEKLDRDRLQAIAICDAKKNNPEFAPQVSMDACRTFVDKSRY